MAGRHVRSEAALETLNSPASKAAIAAAAVGTMFGLAMPVSGGIDGASGAEALAELSSAKIDDAAVPAATEAFTAATVDENAEPVADVELAENTDATELAITVTVPEAQPEVAEEPAEAALVRAAEAQPAQAQPAAATQAAPAAAQPAAAAPAAQPEAAAAQAAPAPVAASGIGSSIVATARQYAGTPYVYGGATPAGFDCSGFVSYVYHQVGLGMPRTTGAMAASYRRISAAEAQPGDLVMWGTYHVGIYTGNGMHIAAHRPGKPLSEGPLYGSYYFLRAY